MNFAIILHPTQTLALIKEQKNLIFNINSLEDENIFYPTYPLWLFVEDLSGLSTINFYDTEVFKNIEIVVDDRTSVDCKNIETLANESMIDFFKNIKPYFSSIAIKSAKLENENLYFLFEFYFDKKKYCGKIKIASSLKKLNGESFSEQEKEKIQKTIKSQCFFEKSPLICKIFQLANVDFDGKTYSAIDTVWVKVKM